MQSSLESNRKLMESRKDRELIELITQIGGFDYAEYEEKQEMLEQLWEQDHKRELMDRANEYGRKWFRNNKKKQRVYSRIKYRPEEYPLDDYCFYCGKTEKLEHGHVDYENDGHNYVTVCRSCNKLMTVNPKALQARKRKSMEDRQD